MRRRSSALMSFSFARMRSRRVFRWSWKDPWRDLPDEGEAQEREGLRFAEPASLAVDRREAAELNQAGLVRVKRQRKFPEPFAHCIKETTCVALILEADGQIVSVTNDDHVALSFPLSPALNPEIEAVMQVDVGKERRNH